MRSPCECMCLWITCFSARVRVAVAPHPLSCYSLHCGAIHQQSKSRNNRMYTRISDNQPTNQPTTVTVTMAMTQTHTHTQKWNKIKDYVVSEMPSNFSFFFLCAWDPFFLLLVMMFVSMVFAANSSMYLLNMHACREYRIIKIRTYRISTYILCGYI